MRPSLPLLFVASVPLTLAYPAFSAPAAGASEKAGTAFTISWADNSEAPSITDLESYQLDLYYGTNTAPTEVINIKAAGTAFSGTSISTTIAASALGGDVTNGYFLKMIATATAGGTVTIYSDRFSVSGMTGTATFTVSGTAGPDDVNDVAGTTTTAAAAAGDGEFATPYQSQTGLTRYAPMQPVPPTSITATNTAPQYPSSSVSTATTYLDSATIATTLTQPGTASFASHANTAIAASMPTDDMQKFLNRWKD